MYCQISIDPELDVIPTNASCCCTLATLYYDRHLFNNIHASPSKYSDAALYDLKSGFLGSVVFMHLRHHDLVRKFSTRNKHLMVFYVQPMFTGILFHSQHHG
jgi:hypothetical protein